MRFLLGLALLILAISVLRTFYSHFLVSARPGSDRQNQAEDPEVTEAMIRCPHCSTYFPASEAISDDAGMAFCSDEHRRRHRSMH